MSLRVLKESSLAVKTALATLTIVVVCMALFGTYASSRLRTGMERTTSEQQFSTVSFAASSVDSALNERMHALTALADLARPTFMADPLALQHFVESRPGFVRLFNGGVFFANADGVAIASVPLSARRHGVSFSEHGYMVAALKEGRPTIGAPMIGKLVHNRIFVMAVPVKDAHGNVIGALMGVTDLDKPNFLDLIGAQPYGKTGGFVLICRYPFMVLSSRGKAHSMQKVNASPDFPGQYGGGREGSGIYLDASGVEMLSSVKSIALTNWYLVAQLPTEEAFEAVRDMRNSMGLASLLFSLLASALTWWYLRRQWFPMFSTVGQLVKMADMAAPLQALPVFQNKELGSLIRAVNRVVQTLEQREAALTHSESLRRAIFDSINAEIAVLDRRGFILAVNAPWLKFAAENAAPSGPGQAPYSSIGVNYLDICSAAKSSEDAEGVAHISSGIRAVLEGRQSSFAFEYPCHSPDQQRWFQTVVTPLNLPEGGVVVAHANITERVQANLARSESEERFVHFMQALPAAAHIKDESGCYVYANPFSQRLLGDADWMGKKAEHYYEPVVSAQCHYSDAEAMQRGTSVFEEDFRGVNGGISSFQVNKFRIVRKDKPPLLGCISLDITQLKQAQAALTVAKAQADMANNAKSRFLAFASHDLRQPLSALSLFIHVLKGRIEPQNRELMAHIEACCTSLSALLADLLDVSKLESGLVKPQLTRFAVGTFMQNLAQVYGATAEKKQVQLRLRMGHHAALAVRTDRSLLTRMVGNFIANAIEHTTAGGVLLALRYRQGRHWIEVWDTGEGMNPRQSQRIGEEFAQFLAEQSIRGSGLGLSIVAKTAALLGLKVRMHSRLGRGSMFAVEVPLVQWAQDIPLAAEPAASRALRIGLVDDHSSARLALALALEAVGHKVLVASTGQELLRQLGDQAPDLVIVDYRPHAEETGLQVIETVRRAFGTHLPAVVISGDTDPGIVGRVEAQGVALRLKPLKMPELEALLATATQHNGA